MHAHMYAVYRPIQVLFLYLCTLINDIPERAIGNLIAGQSIECKALYTYIHTC